MAGGAGLCLAFAGLGIAGQGLAEVDLQRCGLHRRVVGHRRDRTLCERDDRDQRDDKGGNG